MFVTSFKLLLLRGTCVLENGYMNKALQVVQAARMQKLSNGSNETIFDVSNTIAFNSLNHVEDEKSCFRKVQKSFIQIIFFSLFIHVLPVS